MASARGAHADPLSIRKPAFIDEPCAARNGARSRLAPSIRRSLAAGCAGRADNRRAAGFRRARAGRGGAGACSRHGARVRHRSGPVLHLARRGGGGRALYAVCQPALRLRRARSARAHGQRGTPARLFRARHTVAMPVRVLEALRSCERSLPEKRARSQPCARARAFPFPSGGRVVGAASKRLLRAPLVQSSRVARGVLLPRGLRARLRRQGYAGLYAGGARGLRHGSAVDHPRGKGRPVPDERGHGHDARRAGDGGALRPHREQAARARRDGRRRASRRGDVRPCRVRERRGGESRRGQPRRNGDAGGHAEGSGIADPAAERRARAAQRRRNRRALPRHVRAGAARPLRVGPARAARAGSGIPTG